MYNNEVASNGIITFWSLSDGASLEKLRAGFDEAGLGHLVPEKRPAPAILREALEEVYATSRVLVRPLASRDGFAVVREVRGSDENTYGTEAVARVTEDGSVYFPMPNGHSDKVREEYEKRAGLIPATQLAVALVKAVEHLGGTSLRPRGTIYWLNGDRLAAWNKLGSAVEGSATLRSQNVYVVKHLLDADSIRAVKDAVIHEVAVEAKRIREDICSGELGARALASRQRELTELHSKVTEYENILSLTLGDVHAVIENAGQASAVAEMLVASQIGELATA